MNKNKDKKPILPENSVDAVIQTDVVLKQIKELDSEIENNPESYELLKERGNNYYIIRIYDKALEDLLSCFKFNPDDDELNLILYKVYIETNDQIKAFDHITRALAINPLNAEYYYYRGFLKQVLGQFDQAMEDYNQAIDIDPSIPRYYHARGNIYFLKYQNKQSIDEYLIALEKYKSLKDGIVEDVGDDAEMIFQNEIRFREQTLRALGAAYTNKGDYSKALEYFNEVIEITNDLKKAYFYRATTYMQFNKLQLALGDIDFVIKMEPSNPEYHHFRGQIHDLLEDFGASAKDYTKAIEYGSESKELFLYYFYRGNAYYFSKRIPKALEDFTKTIELYPEDFQAYLNRGNCHRDLKEYDKALADYNQSLLIKPDYINGLRNRATLFILKQKYEESNKDLEVIESLEPKRYPDVYYDLAFNHMELGNYKEAEKYLFPILRFYPDDPMVMYNTAKMYSIRKNDKQAKILVRKALDLEPSLKEKMKKDIHLGKFVKRFGLF